MRYPEAPYTGSVAVPDLAAIFEEHPMSEFRSVRAHVQFLSAGRFRGVVAGSASAEEMSPNNENLRRFRWIIYVYSKRRG